ncbi:MAG: hypothetical protein Q8Q49_04170 [bacterium]|nr:hypothetical protein [bacterium]
MHIERPRLLNVLLARNRARTSPTADGHSSAAKIDESSEVCGRPIGDDIFAIEYPSVAGPSLACFRLLRRDGKPWGSMENGEGNGSLHEEQPASKPPREIIRSDSTPLPGTPLEPLATISFVPIPETTAY